MEIRVATALAVAYKALPPDHPARLRMIQLVPGLEELIEETANVMVLHPPGVGVQQYRFDICCSSSEPGGVKFLQSTVRCCRPEEVETIKIRELATYRGTHSHGTLHIWVDAMPFQRPEGNQS